ncbi:MAG: glycosyltransferase [Akkermansiaceae bacterium]|nr:glycosyltransferase [Akkermansiaceae bacterium]
MIKTALILGRNNGVGLDRDASLLADALTDLGIDVKCPRLKNFRDVISREYQADAAFHLERVAPWWWQRKAGTHYLIPNQERFPKRLIGKLERIDTVLCKSHHAEAIFAELHPRVSYMGFTSPDRHFAGANPDDQRFFHLAGRSTLKNTSLLLELWKQHPEWPTLTLVQHPENAPQHVPPNVILVDRYLPDSDLKLLQNSHGIHLCPSLSEGWGHYIVEAMSCGAVVLVTDAPPMNELVNHTRGIVVPFFQTEPRHLGFNYFADPQALENAITRIMTMAIDERRPLGAEARSWFVTNHSAFKVRLGQLLGFPV